MTLTLLRAISRARARSQALSLSTLSLPRAPFLSRARSPYRALAVGYISQYMAPLTRLGDMTHLTHT